MKNLRIIIPLLLILSIVSNNLFAQYDNGTIIYNQTSGTNITSIQKNYIVEDFDGDFNADVIMVKSNTSNNSNYLTWYKGNGNGNFTAQANLLSVNNDHKENEIFYEDMNEDGNKDIVFQNSDNGFSILLNDGQGIISAQIDNELTFDDVISVNLKEVADVDGDGDIDGLFYSKRVEQELGYCLIAYNNGLGVFSNYTYLDNNNPELLLLIKTGDFDGDGNVDIIISGVEINNKSEFFVRFYKNVESNSFSAGEEIKMSSFYRTLFANIKVNDIDNNGVDELLIEVAELISVGHGNSFINNQFKVLSYSLQTGTFVDLETYNSWLHSYNIPTLPNISFGEWLYRDAFHIQFGQQNADNNLDILSVNTIQARLQWYIGDGDGGFTNTQIVNINNQYSNIPPTLSVADFDNDTDLDVFVLLNDGNSSTLTVFKNLALSPSCASVLDLANTSLSDGIYQAGTTTISRGNIVAGNNNVVLKAGNNVKLQSGFKAPANSTLKIRISSCN